MDTRNTIIFSVGAAGGTLTAAVIGQIGRLGLRKVSGPHAALIGTLPMAIHCLFIQIRNALNLEIPKSFSILLAYHLSIATTMVILPFGTSYYLGKTIRESAILTTAVLIVEILVDIVKRFFCPCDSCKNMRERTAEMCEYILPPWT